jgi:hypothetical protein
MHSRGRQPLGASPFEAFRHSNLALAEWQQATSRSSVAEYGGRLQLRRACRPRRLDRLALFPVYSTRMQAIGRSAQVAPTPQRDAISPRGWRDSRPVRVGNGAWEQVQLEVYGELLNSLYVYPERLGPPRPRLGGHGRDRYVEVTTLEEAQEPQMRKRIEQAGRVPGWK